MRRVALVVATRGGLVLFGRRNDNGKYTLPGGHLEEGEDPEAGARRELKEETGLDPVGELKLIDEREVGELKLYTYQCEVDGAPTGAHDPDGECSVWAFFDIADGIPKAVAENLAGPKDEDKNVAKDVFGVDLLKADKTAFAPGPDYDLYNGCTFSEPPEFPEQPRPFHLKDLLVSSRSLRGAMNDIRRGAGSKTLGPLSVHVLEDGRNLLVDGHHRLAEHLASGSRAPVYAKVVGRGHSDTWQTPEPHDVAQLVKAEPLLKAIFSQTAYRHKKTGKVYPSGPIHDYGTAFAGETDPELHQLATAGNNLDEYGFVRDPVVEAGFLDDAGKFYTRAEASAKAYGPERTTGGDSDVLKESGHLEKAEPLAKMALIHNDPAKPVTVYRVQDENGSGPYSIDEHGNPDVRRAAMNRRLPVPMRDMNTSKDPQPNPGRDFEDEEWASNPEVNDRGLLFGFEKPEHATDWFGGANLEDMAAHGFKLVPQLARKVYRSKSGKQVLFAPHGEKGLAKSDINPVPGRIVDYTHRTWPNLQDAGYTLTVRHEPSTSSLHADVRQHGRHVGVMSAAYQHPGKLGPAGHDLQDPELVENAHQALKHRAENLAREIEPPTLEGALRGVVEQDKLQKGAMERLAPIPAGPRANPGEATMIDKWQAGDGDAGIDPWYRHRTPRIEGNLRVRALHKLSAATATRMNEKGEREFLLHRGVSPEERQYATSKPGLIEHDSYTSWSPKYDVARRFAFQYGNGRDILSAWVPESSIHNVPKEYGDPTAPSHAPSFNTLRSEHEIIVGPYHTSKAATPEDIKPITHPRSTLEGRIADAGRRGVDAKYDETGQARVQWTKERLRHRPAPMAKAEEHDEVDRLLLHPDATERRMALKLDGVAERHLIRALQSEDPDLRRQAARHPHFGEHALRALMRMPDRQDLQLRALERDDVRPEHLELLYDTHKDRPTHEKARILDAIGQHGALGPQLIERMFADGNGAPLVENLKTPTHIADKLIEQHLLDPHDDLGRGLARRALQRPDVDPALVARAFKEGLPDVRLAAAGAPQLGTQLITDALTNGQLPAHDGDAHIRLALLARPDATTEHHQLATRDRNNLVREKAARHLQPEIMKKFEVEVGQWLGESLAKATKPVHFAGLARASSQKGRELVDHAPELTAHPAEHGADVQAYRHAILESPKVVEREKHANRDNGITKKVIYQVPPTHPTHGGIRYMLKPYHERVPNRWDHLGKHHHLGWAEMTNQALYHAGGIGHLHQNVHVAEHNMGSDLPKEPALVVKMEPGMDVVHHATTAWKHATPQVKADAQKIALMDFLTNNNDRHSGNLLINAPKRAPLSEGGHILPDAYDRIMAIDHGRSFQYVRSLRTPISRRDQDDELDDSLSEYVRGSGLEQLAPLEDTRLPPYERDVEALRRWAPTFDWWAQNSDKIKAAWAKRLEQIKDPAIRDHLDRNFKERTKHLDDVSRWGIDNFGHSWHSTPVRIYRPGEIE